MLHLARCWRRRQYVGLKAILGLGRGYRPSQNDLFSSVAGKTGNARGSSFGFNRGCTKRQLRDATLDVHRAEAHFHADKDNVLLYLQRCIAGGHGSETEGPEYFLGNMAEFGAVGELFVWSCRFPWRLSAVDSWWSHHCRGTEVYGRVIVDQQRWDRCWLPYT